MRIVDVTGFRYNFGGQTSEYLAHNIDDANDTKYFGFVDFREAWIVMRQVESTGVIRYAVGTSAYEAGWTGRAALTYDLISVVIP